MVGAGVRGVRVEFGDEANGGRCPSARLAAGVLNQTIDDVGDGLLALQCRGDGKQFDAINGARTVEMGLVEDIGVVDGRRHGRAAAHDLGAVEQVANALVVAGCHRAHVENMGRGVPGGLQVVEVADGGVGIGREKAASLLLHDVSDSLKGG